MISVQEIAKIYNLRVSGNLNESQINSVNSLNNQKNDGLSWIKNKKTLEQIKKGFFFVGNDLSLEYKKNVVYLITNSSPKIIFSKILTDLFSPKIDFYLENCIDEHLENKKIKISNTYLLVKMYQLEMVLLFFLML